MLTVDSIIKRNEKIPWRVIDGEAVLVDIGKGEVIHANPVAAAVWDMLDGKKNLFEIIEQILCRFEATPETARQDVIEFANILHEKGLIEFCDG